MRSLFDLAVVCMCSLAAMGSVGCNGQDSKVRNEFEVFEKAMSAVALADRDSRGAAIAHLESLSLTTETVQVVRDLCVEAFTAVGHSEAMLAQARKSTEAAEAALAAPLEDTAQKAASVTTLGQEAARQLSSLEQSIAKAQERVDECDRRRALLRARLSSR